MCNPRTHGTVSFDGQDLHIQDPAPGHSPAILSADADLHVLLDQHPLQEPTAVFAQSQIQFYLPLPIPPKYTFQIQIDPFAIHLTVLEQESGAIYTLPEHEATRHLHLSIHKRQVPLTHFESELRTDFQQRLRREKIHQPINETHFLAALANPGETLCVLETPRPIHPFNRLHFLYALPLPIQPGFALEERVLQPIKAGTLLVERQVSTKSRAGMTVFGEVVPPRQVLAPELKAADRSVRLDIDANHAVSLIEGLPVFDAETGVRMSGLLRQETSISGGPGHIVDLKGSLQLTGGIRDSAQVWVQDYLEVAEDIGHSTVSAEAGLIVHGSIVRSDLRVGGDAAARMTLREPVLNLLKTLEDLLLMVKEVRSRAPQSRLTDDKILFLRVIKTQFSGFAAQVESLWRLNKNLRQLHPRRTMALKVVLSHLMNLNERPLTQRLFEDWLNGLSDFARELVSLPVQANHAYLSYAQGSNLIARGSIFVTGEGCYNSHLSAGQHIVFTGAPGYCREGSLKAEGHIFVPALGSPNGSRLRIEVSANSQVFAHKIYPGVEMCFGDYPPYHVLNTQEGVQVVQTDGTPVFSTFHDVLHSAYAPFFSKEF